MNGTMSAVKHILLFDGQGMHRIGAGKRIAISPAASLILMNTRNDMLFPTDAPSVASVAHTNSS